MRRPALGDASVLARVLMPHPLSRWPWVLRRIMAEARRADQVRLSTGRAHPIWGDGSLMAAGLRRPCLPEPFLDDTRYRWALILVLIAIEPSLSRKTGRAGVRDRVSNG